MSIESEIKYRQLKPGRYELKRMVNAGDWANIGRIFGFQPTYLTINGKQIIDWRCVPKAMADILRSNEAKTGHEMIQWESGRWGGNYKASFKRNKHGKPTNSFRMESYAEQNGKCHYCKKHIDFYSWTVDHRTPKSRGGNGSRDNKVGACRTCNGAKANMTEQEFVATPPHQRKDAIRKLFGHLARQ